MLPTHNTDRIYIAGPMTGIPEFNFPAFNAAAEKLRTEGWDVVNPADHGVIEGAVWADYLRMDIPRLARCGAIYLLPGWENSRGAQLEVHIAATLGLEFKTAPSATDPMHHIAAVEAAGGALLAAPAPVERVEREARVFWVLFDDTGGEKYIKKDSGAGTLAFFDNEEDAARAKRFNLGTDYMRVEYYTATQPAPVERVDQEALRRCFDEIEREICEGKHTAASVFTQMRTAAFYAALAQQGKEGET